MDLGLKDLALFALTVLVLNATPGVDLLLTISRTLQNGVRGGLAAAAGISAGCVIHAIGAAFGLAALLAASAGAFDALKLLGAVYLAWLAFGMWRNALLPADPAAQAPGADAPPSEPVALSVLFSQGLLTNVMNPKVAIFFLISVRCHRRKTRPLRTTSKPCQRTPPPLPSCGASVLLYLDAEPDD